MLFIMNKLLGTGIQKFYKDIQDQSITHIPGALTICDRVLRLEDGNLIEESKDFAFELATYI